MTFVRWADVFAHTFSRFIVIIRVRRNFRIGCTTSLSPDHSSHRNSLPRRRCGLTLVILPFTSPASMSDIALPWSCLVQLGRSFSLG